jgi:hypothetical protein
MSRKIENEPNIHGIFGPFGNVTSFRCLLTASRTLTISGETCVAKVPLGTTSGPSHELRTLNQLPGRMLDRVALVVFCAN